MYYKHNLRVKLQNWRNRLYKANHQGLGNEFTLFMQRIEDNPVLFGLIEAAAAKESIDLEMAKKWLDVYQGGEFVFGNEEKQVAYCYFISRYIIDEWGAGSIANLSCFYGSFEEKKETYLDVFVNPLVQFLHDKLDESNSVLYLLEKYKRRVEWFTRKELSKKYKEATKSYEELLEDDLRLFLFDQGIDYPFSTPKSPSGRADIIGLIDTKNPLVAEIKIYDSDRGYKKNRVVSGFAQTIKYVNDYHKDCGYTIIFNLDNVELVFDFSEEQKTFPPRLTLHNKTYYFVVVNLFHGISASKLGKIDVVHITEQDLLDSLEEEE